MGKRAKIIGGVFVALIILSMIFGGHNDHAAKINQPDAEPSASPAASTASATDGKDASVVTDNETAPPTPRWKAGVEYEYTSDGSCGAGQNCLTPQDAKEMCDQTNSTNKSFEESFINSTLISAGDEDQNLARNNGISLESINWENRDCYAHISAHGTVNGNSLIKNWRVRISMFYVKNSSTIFASSPSPLLDD